MPQNLICLYSKLSIRSIHLTDANKSILDIKDTFMETSQRHDGSIASTGELSIKLGSKLNIGALSIVLMQYVCICMCVCFVILFCIKIKFFSISTNLYAINSNQIKHFFVLVFL